MLHKEFRVKIYEGLITTGTKRRTIDVSKGMQQQERPYNHGGRLTPFISVYGNIGGRPLPPGTVDTSSAINGSSNPHILNLCAPRGGFSQKNIKEKCLTFGHNVKVFWLAFFDLM